LQKEIKAQSFVVKTSGLLKSDRTTTKTFYFAENFDEIDSTNVSGVLINVGQIKQTVDFYTGQSSYGGFNIEVLRIQDTVDDLLDDYYFYNRDIYIYYHIEGQVRKTTPTATLQQVYKGKIENAIVKHDRVVFTVVNDNTLLNKMLPPNITTDGLAKGKIAQYVYGDHSGIKYGVNDTNGTPLQNNTMVKGILATQVGGNYRWIVGGNGSDLTIAATNALWIWHSEYKRFMQITTAYTTGTDAQGNAYVEIAPQDGFFVDAYDYIMPTNVTRSGTPNWESPANAINDKFDISDPNAYAQATLTDADGGDTYLNVRFSDVPTYATLDKDVYFGVDDNGIDTFEISGYGATSDITAVGGYSNRAITLADGSLPSTISFRAHQIATHGDNWARVSNCFMRLELRVMEMQDVYIGVNNANDYTQRTIIEHLATECGITYTDNADVAAITMAGVLSEQKKAVDHIRETAKQGACVAMINGDNEITVDEIDMSATADKTLDIGDIEIESVVIGESSLHSLVNDMTVNYYADSYTGGLSEIANDTNGNSCDIYGTYERVLDANFITAAASSASLLDYHVNGTTATFFTELRSTVEFYTRDIRGTVPYDGSGNFHPLIELELGDHFSLPAALDNYLTCNGESWSGMVFKIIGYGIEAGRLWLKGIYIRTV